MDAFFYELSVRDHEWWKPKKRLPQDIIVKSENKLVRVGEPNPYGSHVCK